MKTSYSNYSCISTVGLQSWTPECQNSLNLMLYIAGDQIVMIPQWVGPFEYQPRIQMMTCILDLYSGHGLNIRTVR